MEGAENPLAEISEQLAGLYAQKDAAVETVIARLAPLEAKLAELDPRRRARPLRGAARGGAGAAAATWEENPLAEISERLAGSTPRRTPPSRRCSSGWRRSRRSSPQLDPQPRSTASPSGWRRQGRVISYDRHPNRFDPAPDLMAQAEAMKAMNPNSSCTGWGSRSSRSAPTGSSPPCRWRATPSRTASSTAVPRWCSPRRSAPSGQACTPARARPWWASTSTPPTTGPPAGLVTGTATALSLGRTLACYEVVVTDEDGRRVCTSRITCLIRDTAPGS